MSLTAPQYNVLKTHLFNDRYANAYAVLDGASITKLPHKLYQNRPEHVCLYRGELEPDLAEVAPYLIRLEQNSPFTEMLIEEGWLKHWGIFLTSYANLTVVRQHLRKFLMVRHPDGRALYFRFYDPRVLKIFLPSCTKDELEQFFGPVKQYLAEDEDTSQCLSFSQGTGILQEDALTLNRRKPMTETEMQDPTIEKHYPPAGLTTHVS